MRIYYYIFSLLLLTATTGYSASTAAEATEASASAAEKKSTPVEGQAKESERHPIRQSTKPYSLGTILEGEEYDCKGDKGYTPPLKEKSEPKEESDSEED